MPKGFLPNKDHDLLAWGRNFVQQVSSHAAELGVGPALVTSLVDAAAAWETAYQITRDPARRTVVTICDKDTARDIFKREARSVAALVKAQAHLPPQWLFALGLNVRKAYARIPVPASKPIVYVVGVRGRKITLRLAEPDQASRALPKGVAGARIYVYVGEHFESNLDAWRFVAMTSRTRTTIDPGPAATPGSKVWIAACWVNPRQEQGGMSTPVMTYTQFGGVEDFKQQNRAA